jgi:hypothetical protein
MGVHDHPTVWACVNPHRHNTTLHTLELDDNQIGAVGASAIGEGFQCVHTYRAFASLLLM